MPKDEFGEFSYIVVGITNLGLFLSFSFYIPFIKNYCESENEKNRKEWTSVIFTLIITIIILLDIIFLLNKEIFVDLIVKFFDIKKNIEIKYYLFIVLINTSILGLYFYSLVVAINKVIIVNLFIAIKFIAITAFSICALYFELFSNDSVVNRLMGMAIAEFIFTLFCIIMLLKMGIYISYKKIIIKRASFVALPLIPSAIVGMVISLIDRKLLVEYHGLETLAEYNLAIQALAPIALVMTAFQTIWAPNLFSIKDSKFAFEKTKKLIVYLFILMFLASIVISLITHITIKFEIISINYSAVPLLIFYLSLGIIIAQLNHLISNLFVKENIVKYQLILNVILLLVNYIMNVILIPKLAINGAILAMIFSYLLVFLLGLFILIARNNRLNK
jgi:O-antigen/teichoic acid export membrane protein